jgi:adenylate cyclase class 2
MQTEIEAKWLNIDKDAFRKKLTDCGAKLIHEERKMVRQTFDYPGMRLEKDGGWVRVRDESDKITMSYKQLNDRSLHGTKEVGLVIDSFENACNFLEAIGLKSNAVQETMRESWELDEASVEIDTWPWIPSFVEIEAKDEATLRSVANKLGLDFDQALHGSVENAYMAVYDVTEHDVDEWPEIRFGEVPDWLKAKKK